MAKKKSAKATKKKAAKKRRLARKVGVKAASKRELLKKKMAVAKKKPAKKATPKKKIAAKKKAATEPAAVVPPHPAPVQSASMQVEPVPSLVEASQPQSSLIGKPITGTGGEVSSTLSMRPQTETQPLDMVQEASEESFPASDSPAITRRKPR